MSVINETPKIDTIISALSDTQKATLLSILNTNDNAIADYSASIPSTVTGGVTLANCVTPDGLRTGIVFYTGAYQCWFVTYDNRPYCDVYSYDNGKWTAYPRQHLSLLEMRNYLAISQALYKNGAPVIQQDSTTNSTEIGNNLKVDGHINSNPEYYQKITTDMLPTTLTEAGWTVSFGEIILKDGKIDIILSLYNALPTTISYAEILIPLADEIASKIITATSDGFVESKSFNYDNIGVTTVPYNIELYRITGHLKIKVASWPARSSPTVIRINYNYIV